MTEGEQINALSADIGKVIDRYRAEFNLTLAAVVGVLEVSKLLLILEQARSQESPET